MNHTIVAMVGEQIVRVECNTCHGTHNYHAVKEAGPARESASRTVREKSATPRVSRLDPAAAERDAWAALQPLDPAEAVPYDMSGRYRKNDLVHHPAFGLGVVQSVLPNKAVILFRDGKKLLRCG
jgi:hypothetical protein